VTIDLDAAASFLAAHGRVLDQRRFEGDAAAILAAVDGYRNPDGGYGWGLEPDLRSPESQPACALHALEAMADAAPAASPHAAELCDWLESVTLPDGGLPFALPVSDPAGVAPFWANADPSRSSLQITAFVAAMAHRLPAVAGHRWLARAGEYCATAIRALDEAPHALVITAALSFADAVGDPDLVERLGRFVPGDGVLRVAGGTEDEAVRPLDLAPRAGGAARALFRDDVVAAELERLRKGQQPDGGWTVDFTSYSPAAALEWRGYATVRAVAILRGDGVI